MIIVRFLLILIAIDLTYHAQAADIAPSRSVELTQENLFIVEPYVGSLIIDNYLEIYRIDGELYIPLGGLSNALNFAITVNETRAYGWYISEDNDFLLNRDTKKLRLKGRDLPYPESHHIYPLFDDIYISQTMLTQWFPLDFELNQSQLSLIITPREKLPIQKQLERERNRQYQLQGGRGDATYEETIEQPYSRYNHPFFDVDLNYGYDNSREHSYESGFSVLAQTDMFYMNGRLAALGDSEDGFTGLRYRMEKQDYQGKLLGDLQAKTLAIGDVESFTTPLVSTRSRGRGIAISNFKLDRPDQFDSTSLTGDSKEGWEVELYRNGVLLDFSRVGSDGRYEFNNVPIFYGNNQYKIISYGPQGEVREEIKTFLIDDTVLKEGEFQYQFSADEKSRSLFGVDEEQSTILHENGVRLIANAEYGLTKDLTVTSGLIRSPLIDGEFHDYQTFGLRSGYGGLFWQLNSAYDHEDGGWATEAQVQSRIQDMNVTIRQGFFNAFSSEVFDSNSQKYQSRTRMDVDGVINTKESLIQGISYGLSTEYENYENNREDITLESRLSGSIENVGLSNLTRWERISIADNETDSVTGIGSIRSRYQGYSLRLSSDYTLEPDVSIDTLNLSVQKRFANKLDVIGEIQQGLTDRNVTSANVSVNKTFSYLRGSLFLQGNDDNDFSIGSRISFALGHDPRTQRWQVTHDSIASQGAVSVLAYLDENYNSILDEEEDIMENVSFKVDGQSVMMEGRNPAFIPNVSVNIPTSIAIIMDTLDDPFWMPKHEGFQIITHPGVVTEVNFPVMPMTEIDGVVYVKRGDNITPSSRVRLELVNTQGNVVAEDTSEFDGFYLLNRIVPGNYVLRISDADLKRFQIETSPTIEIEVKNVENILSNIDLVIEAD